MDGREDGRRRLTPFMGFILAKTILPRGERQGWGSLFYVLRKREVYGVLQDCLFNFGAVVVAEYTFLMRVAAL